MTKTVTLFSQILYIVGISALLARCSLLAFCHCQLLCKFKLIYMYSTLSKPYEQFATTTFHKYLNRSCTAGNYL